MRKGVDLGLRRRHDLDADEVHPAQVARHADHDDQLVSVPDGAGGAQARTYPPFLRGVEPENPFWSRCGYLGVLPTSFAEEWTLRSKVLGIVDDNATAIDARLPVGAITMAKLSPSFDRLSVVQGELTGYAQYPGSDCVNGAVLKVPDGHRLMNNLSSHHYLLLTGHNLVDIQMIAGVFGLQVDPL